MRHLLFLALGLLVTGGAVGAEPDPVDFERARQLIDRMKSGESLTADERAYVARARAERQRRLPADGPAGGVDDDKARELYRRWRQGGSLSAEERAYLERARQARREGGRSGVAAGKRNQRQAPLSLKPLCDMGADEHYEGREGGLYGGGRSNPPESLQEVADTALGEVGPIDGKVVFNSISMSNATMEFSTFKRMADADGRKSGQVTIVDCAQGGQAMAQWADPEGKPWSVALQRIRQAGATPEQVQVTWIKLANRAPGGSMEEHLEKLEADTLKVIENARSIFPNLRVAYLGSRIWGGEAKTPTNPEPYAYEGAFAVRHLIQGQDVEKRPLLLWGPYLWAEGSKGRGIDDLIWLPEDFNADGTHPSVSGRDKVGKLLLEFFATDPLAQCWFAK